MSAQEVQDGIDRDMATLDEVAEDGGYWDERGWPESPDNAAKATEIHYPALDILVRRMEEMRLTAMVSLTREQDQPLTIQELQLAVESTRDSALQAMFWFGYALGLRRHEPQQCNGSHHQSNPHAN